MYLLLLYVPNAVDLMVKSNLKAIAYWRLTGRVQVLRIHLLPLFSVLWSIYTQVTPQLFSLSSPVVLVHY